MPASGHSPRHSRHSRTSSYDNAKRSPDRIARTSPKRPRRPRRSGWLAVVATAATVLGTATAALHAAGHPASTAAFAAANCAAPELSADSSGETPLGVNVTSTSQLTTATAEFGHLPVIRTYYTGMPDPNAWTTGSPGLNDSAVVVSFRSLPSTVLSGADDAALAHFFDTAPTGHPIYYSYYHEPEPLISSGQFTVDQYKAAWTHIVAIADAAHNPDLRSTLILMSWDLNPASGLNWKDFLPSGNVISTMGWDAYPAGTVENKNPQPTSPADFMGPEVAASKSVGLPFGFAEFALGTAQDRPQWLAEVASYLQSSGALFGTLFNSVGFPWMELNDSASVQSWRAAVTQSQTGGPVATPPTQPPTSQPPAPTPTASAPDPAPSTPAPSASPTTTTPAPAPPAGGPQITGTQVSPAAFAPTGANHVRIMFKLGSAANVAICVLNRQGTAVVRELDKSDPAGWASTWYFGYQTSGGLLSPGTYPVVIVAADATGTSTTRTSLTIAAPQ
jgi:hypothetical protein